MSFVERFIVLCPYYTDYSHLNGIIRKAKFRPLATKKSVFKLALQTTPNFHVILTIYVHKYVYHEPICRDDTEKAWPPIR